jgi:nitronate monooxygenase
MLAASWHEPDVVREIILETKSLTNAPFGVNLVLEWDQREKAAIALELGVALLSLFWGDPTEYISMAKRVGVSTSYTAGSVAEAVFAAEKGAELIVAQGVEAGGHVRGRTPLSELIQQIASSVSVPVIAAGGLADGADIAHAISQGGCGGWLGTRFLLSQESAIHDEYRRRLLAASGEDTVYSEVFDVGWSKAPHRVLRNTTYVDAAKRGRMREGEVIARYPDGHTVVRYSMALPRPGVIGNIEAMALYCGEGVGKMSDCPPASELVQRLAREIDEAAPRP